MPDRERRAPAGVSRKRYGALDGEPRVPLALVARSCGGEKAVHVRVWENEPWHMSLAHRASSRVPAAEKSDTRVSPFTDPWTSAMEWRASSVASASPQMSEARRNALHSPIVGEGRQRADQSSRRSRPSLSSPATRRTCDTEEGGSSTLCRSSSEKAMTSSAACGPSLLSKRCLSSTAAAPPPVWGVRMPPLSASYKKASAPCSPAGDSRRIRTAYTAP